MNAGYKISIIIPTYKPHSYIWECFDSIIAQTMHPKDFEIIVVLNGCNEPYYSDVKAYLEKHRDYHFDLIQVDEGGVSNARNIGLKRAMGDFIVFLDDDDVLSNNYLQGLYDTSSCGVMALSNLLCFKESVANPYPDYITKSYERLKNMPSFCIMQARHFLGGPVAKLIPSEAAKAGQYDNNLRIGEDVLYNFQISWKYPKRFKCAPEDVVYYRRIRERSATRTNTLKSALLQNHYEIKQILIAWSKRPFKYSFPFMVTRILGALSGDIHKIKDSIVGKNV